MGTYRGTYDDAVAYLNSFTDHEKTGFGNGKIEFDIEKLRTILVKMNEPQKTYRSVHIAGTKGKGSVATFTSSILKANGYKVGLYTSPHLCNIRERIKIDGEDISEEEFARVLSGIRSVLDGAPCHLTYFEILTLIAILHFKDEKVDFAVFEAGLGGRLDATNVVNAEVSGITSISHDHMQVLGDKLEKITREKAAIIKPGSRCVSSPQRGDVLDILKETCRIQEAELAIVGEGICYSIKDSGEEGSLVDIKGIRGLYEACRINMIGDFQAENAAAAVGIAEEVLRDKEPDIENFKKGIADAFIPGRMEIVSREPLFVVDGAHNKASANRLKYSVEQILKYDRLILLLGISKDKDIRSICEELVPLSDEVIITRSSSQRSADPGMIRGYIRGRKVIMTETVKEGLGAALAAAGENDLILATGSFYLVGDIKRILGETGGSV